MRLLHPTLKKNVAKMPAETLLLNLAAGFFGKEGTKMTMTPISMNKDHYYADDPYSFPYIIERLMSGGYLRREVFFLEKTNGRCFFNITADSDKNNFYIDESDAFVKGKITATARKKLIGAVSMTSQISNRRLCVVFSTNDAVYCEPDGSKSESTDIPSGGVLFVPS